MKIDKLFNGLKRIGGGNYVFDGDLISEDTIEIVAANGADEK